MKSFIKTKQIIFVVLIALLFGFSPNIQAQEYKRTDNYLVKNGLYSLCVEVHLKYKADKRPVMDIIDELGGVDHIGDLSLWKYQFEVYFSEVYNREWIINNIIKTLDEYFANKDKNIE